jgi:hypothetical protein
MNFRCEAPHRSSNPKEIIGNFFVTMKVRNQGICQGYLD